MQIVGGALRVSGGHFLSDEISNKAEESWTRDAIGGYGPYSVTIMDYEGCVYEGLVISGCTANLVNL